MTQRQYDKATAQAIMQWAYSDYQNDQNKPYEIRNDGVYVNDVFREFCPPGTIYDWTPADCMDGPESPNPDIAPALPIPFTAADLAACMLDGVGQTICQRVGAHIGSPIDDSVLANFHPRMRWMRDALREAYALAAEAQNIVGELDHAEQQSAHDLLARYSDAHDQAIERERVMERVVVGTKKDGNPEYGGFIPRDEYLRRLERAKASVSDLKAQANSAKARADEKHRAWREAMVRQLLNPEQPIATPAPETDSANNAPVLAGSESNEARPLTTGDIAFCFDGIRWNEQQWRKPLGDKPKWLQSCVAIPGQQGVSETRWNPVLIAAALVHDGHTQARSIRARFQTKMQLRDWLEAWKTYEADNFDTP